MTRNRQKGGGGGDATSTRLARKVQEGGSYFAKPKKHIGFISSGCKTLDLALGGGWAENRISNIVGDKSTGKTLLAIEAAANFSKKYPKGKIRYAECEAAFDPGYAEALGMPIDRVDFGSELETVEDLFDELNKLVGRAKTPTLYILDSLDALSDRAEMDRDLGEGTFGASKAKQMSQLFRRLNKRLSQSNVTLVIISQVRDKIGISFGVKYDRSGGRALDFYASQVVYLANLGREKRRIKGIERATAIKIKAQVTKNKIGLPFRESQFEIGFGYGVDDYRSCLDFLAEVNAVGEVGIGKDEKARKEEARAAMRWEHKQFAARMAKVHDVVERKWYEIETGFLPTRRKYA